MIFKQILNKVLSESLSSIDQLKSFFLSTGGAKGYWYRYDSGGYPHLNGDIIEKFFPKVVQLEKMPSRIINYFESDIDVDDKHILYFCVVYYEQFSDIESDKEAVIKIVAFSIDMGNPENKDDGRILYDENNFKLKKKIEGIFNSEEEYANFMYKYMQVRGTKRMFGKHIKRVKRYLKF